MREPDLECMLKIKPKPRHSWLLSVLEEPESERRQSWRCPHHPHGNVEICLDWKVGIVVMSFVGANMGLQGSAGTLVGAHMDLQDSAGFVVGAHVGLHSNDGIAHVSVFYSADRCIPEASTPGAASRLRGVHFSSHGPLHPGKGRHPSEPGGVASRVC